MMLYKLIWVPLWFQLLFIIYNLCLKKILGFSHQNTSISWTHNITLGVQNMNGTFSYHMTSYTCMVYVLRSLVNAWIIFIFYHIYKHQWYPYCMVQTCNTLTIYLTIFVFIYSLFLKELNTCEYFQRIHGSCMSYDLHSGQCKYMYIIKWMYPNPLKLAVLKHTYLLEFSIANKMCRLPLLMCTQWICQCSINWHVCTIIVFMVCVPSVVVYSQEYIIVTISYLVIIFEKNVSYGWSFLLITTGGFFVMVIMPTTEIFMSMARTLEHVNIRPLNV